MSVMASTTVSISSAETRARSSSTARALIAASCPRGSLNLPFRRGGRKGEPLAQEPAQQCRGAIDMLLHLGAGAVHPTVEDRADDERVLAVRVRDVRRQH